MTDPIPVAESINVTRELPPMNGGFDIVSV